MSGWTYAVLAYMAAWAGLAAYVAALSRRQKRLEREVRALENRLGRGEG